MSKLELSNNILNELNTLEDLSFISRRSNSKDWERFLNEIKYAPFLYTNESITYQEEYRKNDFKNYLDLSSIILFKGSIIGIFPIGVCVIREKYFIFSQTNFNGLNEPPPLNKPIFNNLCSEKIINKVSGEIYLIIEKIAKLLNIKAWRSADNFEGFSGITPWHLLSMRKGSKVSLIHELYVDLTLDLSFIKSKFRKSYKALIKEEKFDLTSFVMSRNDHKTWSEFKKLHLHSAGRVTRTDESWKMHFENINNNCGMLIYVRDKEGLFLGGGFFNFSKDEAVYSVAAYNRDLFHLPLGHIVQFRAINELKKMSIKWYRIGHLPFKGDEVLPSDKYLNIGIFKKGFATKILPKYIFKHKLLEL